MKSNRFIVHLLLAAALSFGVSTAVWKLLDIYDPTGFIVASASAAVIGALAGWYSGRLLATTLFATILLRGAILFFAIGG